MPFWLSDAGELDYSVKGNSIQTRVAKKLLGINGVPDSGFKWSDNMQQEGEITGFILNGDAAPGGRFNYHYNAGQ